MDRVRPVPQRRPSRGDFGRTGAAGEPPASAPLRPAVARALTSWGGTACECCSQCPGQSVNADDANPAILQVGGGVRKSALTGECGFARIGRGSRKAKSDTPSRDFCQCVGTGRRQDERKLWYRWPRQSNPRPFVLPEWRECRQVQVGDRSANLRTPRCGDPRMYPWC